MLLEIYARSLMTASRVDCVPPAPRRPRQPKWRALLTLFSGRAHKVDLAPCCPDQA
ncbi:MAG: hypothetical protein MRY77_01860 [Rhodobacteraceae bacterium]|nr:hypothetical protein [Paracoccaceae bacterium]